MIRKTLVVAFGVVTVLVLRVVWAMLAAGRDVAALYVWVGLVLVLVAGVLAVVAIEGLPHDSQGR